MSLPKVHFPLTSGPGFTRKKHLGLLLSACSIKVFGGGASRIRTADLWIMIPSL